MESKSEYFEQPIQKVAGWIVRERIMRKRILGGEDLAYRLRILGERIWRIG